MKNSHLIAARSARGSTRVGVLVGLALGVALTAFVLLDPFALHSLDERLGGAATLRSDDEPGAAEKQLWTCGMHPNVVSEEPGSCPICHMDLVPLEHGDSATESGATREWTCPVHDVIAEAEAGACPICGRDLVPAGTAEDHVGHSSSDAGPVVALDRAVIQKMNLRTAAVERRDLVRRISTVGNLDYDEERMVSVTTRTSGFVERVDVNYIGQPVRRGDPLFEIYSPELVQTQRELISASRYANRFEQASPEVRARAEALVEAARNRLAYWGIAPERIADIERTGDIQRTVTVTAPADGIVMQRIHGLDGMAVEPGMDVIHIADLSNLWLRVEVYESQVPWIDIGASAEVSFDSLPGTVIRGRVRFMEPEVSPETRTASLTLEVPNPTGRLRVGMFATVSLSLPATRDALVVPAQAVIRTGDRDIAVVALGDGRFAPLEIAVGSEVDGWVEVVDGLTDGDRIVTSAQFLIDSESNLRAAISSMLSARNGHSR